MDAVAIAPSPSTVIPTHARRRWVVSVDLGQSIDPTAVAVLEVITRQGVRDAYWDAPEAMRPTIWEPPRSWFRTTDVGLELHSPKAPARIVVRHLNRLPLRMAYPDQVAHVAKLLKLPPLDRERPDLVVDQTGVGRPVVDMFRRAGMRPIGCTITAGTQETQDEKDRTEWRVAKLLLVSRLQAALHEQTLNIANVPDAQTLGQELADFRGVFTDTGYARFGARDGAHDDLVLAVAIGVWYASRPVRTATVFQMPPI
jgi:hypothetical protein